MKAICPLVGAEGVPCGGRVFEGPAIRARPVAEVSDKSANQRFW